MDYPHSIPDVALHEGKFTDGTADGVIPPSRDPAAWANAVTDEILTVIQAAGLAANEADTTQLAQAIQVLIAAAIAALPSDTVTVVTLVDGATITWDMADGEVAEVTLGGNRTLGAPAHVPPAGHYLTLRVIQDATGGRALAYASAWRGAAGIALATAAGAVTHLTWRSTGSALELVGWRAAIQGAS